MNKRILFAILFFVFSNHSAFAQSLKPHIIAIVVSDLEQATEWYENTLELTLYKELNFPEYDSLKINFLKRESFQIELIEKKTAFSIKEYVKDYDANVEPLIGFCKVSFLVPDVESEYERIKKLNVEEFMGITEDKDFMTEYFFVKDTDGNLIQFIEQLEE